MTDSKVINILGSVGLVAKRQSSNITKDFVQSEESSTVKRPKKNRTDETKADTSELKAIKKRSNKTGHNCPKCKFSTPISSNLKNHLKCHGQNAKFKCPHCDFSCNHKHWVQYHSVHSHKSTPSKVPSDKKRVNHSSADSRNCDMEDVDKTTRKEVVLMDVESININRQLTDGRGRPLRLLRPKPFSDQPKNTPGPANVNNAVIPFGYVPKEKAYQNGSSEIETPDNQYLIEKAAENQDLIASDLPFGNNGDDLHSKDAEGSNPQSRKSDDYGNKKIAENSVQKNISSSEKISLEELDLEEKTVRELINKLETDLGIGWRSLSAAQLENATASELKKNLERCLKILGDGHGNVPSVSVFQTMSSSAHNGIKKVLTEVEAAPLVALSTLKRAQKELIVDLKSAKMRLANVEEIKLKKMAQDDEKKMMELLNRF